MKSRLTQPAEKLLSQRGQTREKQEVRAFCRPFWQMSSGCNLVKLDKHMQGRVRDSGKAEIGA